MKKSSIVIIIVLLLLCIPAILPLLHHGFFQTDDGEWMIIRLSAFYQAMHDGQFPVRFLQRLNYGYGYPVAEFLYPGIMYLGTFLHIFKIGFVESIKIIMGISLIGSALFTYLWLSTLFTRAASLVGALFALYIPYHLYDAYTRGSIGELFALLWVPFILWQIERKSIFFTAIGIGLLIISHNSIALLFLPVLFLYAFLRKLFTIRLLLSSFFLGILLSSFFIIPAVFELGYTVFSQTAVSNPSSYFAELPLIGSVSILVLLLISVMVFIKKKEFTKYRSLIILFFLLSLATLFFSMPLSANFWQIPQAAFIQFPFRLLSYLTISIAFLAAVIVTLTSRKQPWVAMIILLGFLAFSALPYTKPQSYFQKDEGYYYTNDATTTVKDEYMPVWVKEKPKNRPAQPVEIVKGQGDLNSIVATNNSLTFVADLKKPTTIQANIIYWPGWTASVDGVATQISHDNPKGVMVLTVPEGKHIVKLSFGESPLRLFADILSIVAFVSLLFITRKSKHKK